jgi:uncharacterized delta-60 repeat protein
MTRNKQINVIIGNLLLTIFVILSTFNLSFAADGDLDLTFNGTGKVITHIGDTLDDANDSAVQSDGKLVVVGTSGNAQSEGFAVARYNVDGSLDLTFNGTGKVLTQILSTGGYAYSVAIQADSKIVVAGGGTERFDGNRRNISVVVRYNTNGSLDTSFAGDGIAEISDEYTGEAYSVAIGSDGKIVIAGHSQSSLNGEDNSIGTLIARYNVDGSLDTRFGNDGIVITPHKTYDLAATVAIQPDGKILTRGYNEITRYNTNGSIDTAFGNNGKIDNNCRCSFRSNLLKVQPDGKIVAVGYAISGNSNYGRAVYRFNTDGSPDVLFGNNGIVLVGMNSYAYSSMTIQTDGKILILEDFNSGNLAIVRLNPDGTRDLSFDGDGIVLYPTPDQLFSVSIAVGSNGKIFTTSRLPSSYSVYSVRDFIVTVYNSDGSKDTSFGQGGTVTTGEFAGMGQITSMAVQSDGKIIAAGYSNANVTFIADFAVVRYNINGTLDTSFGSSGKVSTMVGDYRFSSARAVAIQTDGKIVVAGTGANSNGAISGFAVVRYNQDGSLDNTFDGDGKVLTEIGGSAISVLIQPDGKIVAAGTNFYGRIIIRYNSDGSLDNTFGNNGIYIESNRKVGNIISMAIQSDGKLVTLGTFYSITSNSFVENGFAIARYNSNGTTDNTFGENGKSVTRLESRGQVTSLKIQADGKIIVAGNSKDETASADTVDGTKQGFAVFRYNPNGSLDNTFDGDGKVYTSFENGAYAASLSIQADNKIVVAGNTYTPAYDSLFATARYNSDGSLDSTFGRDGKLATAAFGGKHSWAASMAIQPNGKIIVGGVIGGTFGLVRYQGTPVAQTSGVGGRMTTANGNAISNVSVQISGGKLSEPKFTRTNSFGYYRFQDLEVGQTYIMSVAAKRYTFANPTRVINLDEDLTGEDFVSDSK